MDQSTISMYTMQYTGVKADNENTYAHRIHKSMSLYRMHAYTNAFFLSTIWMYFCACMYGNEMYRCTRAVQPLKKEPNIILYNWIHMKSNPCTTLRLHNTINQVEKNFRVNYYHSTWRPPTKKSMHKMYIYNEKYKRSCSY